MEAIIGRAKKVKLLLLDVDGVLTDGRVIHGNYGDELKSFDVRDGLGISLLKKAGIRCAIVTVKGSRVVGRRARALKIDKVYGPGIIKIKSLPSIKHDFRVKEEEICFAGDDIIDLPLLKKVGFAVAVSNAVDEVKKYVHYTTHSPGGRGAVRELSEIILKAQGKWEEVAGKFLG